MFHKKLFLLLAVTTAVTLSGCGGKEEPAQEPSNSSAPDSTASDSAQTELSATKEAATEAMSEFSETLKPITPSDYLVADVSKYITLGSLDHLSATQMAYEVTDEMVQERVDEELAVYSEEKEVEKAAEGNTVYADVTSSIQGVEGSESTESTYFVIGDEDYGAEFDAKLIGCSAGDELEFSVDYEEDVWYEEWENQTVDFKVNVTAVNETIVPDYTEDFVTTNTEFASKAEFEEALREEIEDEYTQDSYSDTINSLFQTVIDQSTLNGYPQELYDACEADTLSYYAQFLGTDDRDEIQASLGLSEDDLEDDILNTVNLRLAVCAICEAQGLEITEEEYISEVTEEADMYGYLSPVEYEEASTREMLVWDLYQNKAAEYLYDHAEITPVEVTEDEFYDELGEFDEFETESETLGADEFYAAEIETEE